MKIVFSFLIFFTFLIANVDISKLEKEANSGNVQAIIQLAMMYENGDGVEQDLQKATKYYRQAAELGSEDAKLSLSLIDLYKLMHDKHFVSLQNQVVIKDYEGLEYKLSIDDIKDIISRAKSKDKEAFFTLATLYFNGFGDIKPNRQRAISLYKKAAELGSKKAEEFLKIVNK